MIYVDADACPVKSEAEAVATRHRVPLALVCNGGLRPSANYLFQSLATAYGLSAIGTGRDGPHKAGVSPPLNKEGTWIDYIDDSWY